MRYRGRSRKVAGLMGPFVGLAAAPWPGLCFAGDAHALTFSIYAAWALLTAGGSATGRGERPLRQDISGHATDPECQAPGGCLMFSWSMQID